VIFLKVKRLVAVVLNCNKFNQLIYFLIDIFHLRKVKSTDCFGNQIVEFCNSLTIKAVIFETEVCWSFLKRKSVMETCENSLFRDHTVCSSWRLILDQFLELLAWFKAWRKWFVVGLIVLPLRFNLSQALCMCLVVFQVCKRVLVVLVWFKSLLCGFCIFWQC